MAESEIQDVLLLYEDELLDLMRNTTMSESERRSEAQRLFREYAEDAYTKGQITAGGDGILDDEDKERIDEWVDTQLVHIRGFSDFVNGSPEDLYPVLDKETAEEEHSKRTDERANWWLLALGALAGYAAFKIWSGLNQEGQWVMGNRKKHCLTCIGLDGVIAPLSWFFENGYMPREPASQSLNCGGWRCGCKIIDPRTGIKLLPFVFER